MTSVGGRAASPRSFDGVPEVARPLAERYAALTGILTALGTGRFTQEMFRSVALELRPIAKFSFVNLQLYDEESNDYHRYTAEVVRGPRFVLSTDVRKEETGAWWVYKQQQPLAIPHMDRENRFRRVIETLQGIGIRSVYLFPLTTAHRRLGSVAFTCDRQETLSDEEIRFLSAVTSPIAMAVGNALRYGRLPEREDTKTTQHRSIFSDPAYENEIGAGSIVGKSAALGEVLSKILTVAPTSATVMIYGETGTGKELIARAIHNLSPRRFHPFVNLNCAAIPAGLLESELFGHERGAFTGAIAQRVGRFELASQGSIFLDEVGEIPLDMQPKLLRVLQEKEFERLGSARTRRTDARLIAATNGNLFSRIEHQTFRSDLYFRLNVFPIHVPPLRERREDIPLLVDYFVERFSRRLGKRIGTIPSETMRALTHYDWPGNIRELQNVLERAVILSPDEVLMVAADELRSRSSEQQAAGDAATPAGRENLRRAIEDVERDRILRALDQAKWVVSGPNGAAARVGMNRSTLQFRMRKLGIPSRRP